MARAPALQESEVYPEADRLDGTPHPRMTAMLYGHQGAERMLAGELASGRLHHGWLITGPAGIGKATLAYQFARAALSQPDERDREGRSLAVASSTPGSRQVRALSHPGLLVLRRQYQIKEKRAATTITVDDVRRLRQFLSHSAEATAWRIVIIDTADDLNNAAANAVLKSLEEPPPRTVFFLLSSQPGRLLPTIRSRCRVLPLEPLAAPDLKRAHTDAIEAEGGTSPSASDWTKLEALSGGSVRRVASLSANGGLALYETIHSFLSDLPKSDGVAAHALAEKLAPVAAEQQFELFFDLLSATLAKLIKAAATGQGTPADVALSHRLIGAARLAQFAQAWETIQQEKADADALNLDRKSLILETLARLERASR